MSPKDLPYYNLYTYFANLISNIEANIGYIKKAKDKIVGANEPTIK